MEPDDLTKEQAKEVCTVIERHQLYLLRLRTRMEECDFHPNDQLHLRVCKAFDAVMELRMAFHYLACDGAGRKSKPPSGGADQAAEKSPDESSIPARERMRRVAE